MKSIVRQRVWWPNISKDVHHWVESCKTCTLNGKPEKTTPMERIFAPDSVWEMIAIDFNGPYARFGGISILVLVDYRSRYLIAKPVKSTSFECTSKALDEVFEREGYPKSIKSDNGPPFNGDDYKRYCAQRGISTLFSTPLFPQQNGMVESYMKLINKAMSSASTNKTSFVDELREAVNAHNAASHSVTGVPPEEVMLGRKVKRGLPLLQRGKATFDEKLFESSDRQSKISGKHREDARRGAKPCTVKPGDTVVVERQNRAKGDTRFHPKKYIVLREKNGSLVLNDETGLEVRRHVSQTKRVYDWREETGTKKPSADKPTRNVEPGAVAEPAGATAVGPPPTTAARDVRKRKAPSHLKDYVRSVLDNSLDIC
ncbi:uncharacterized protein K02A2.6-like [Aedes albopictus]|uniref:RNA-directed DNA polymerase n=1 Tax=Aedes albopictus TaxID=7160 RepID=A0ABM1YZ45_AEDAL